MGVQNGTGFQSFNIGKDIEVHIQLKNVLGAIEQLTQSDVTPILNLGILERFSANPMGDEIKVIPCSYNGRPIFRSVHSGWAGMFDTVRQGPSGDILAQLLQEAYHGASGAILVDVSQRIIDPAGAVYGHIDLKWPDCSLRQTDAGTYEGEGKVVQKWEFKAGERDIEAVFGGLDPFTAIMLAQLTAVTSANVAAKLFGL